MPPQASGGQGPGMAAQNPGNQAPPSQNDYDEGGFLEKVTGPALRPGGLMITEKALGFCSFAKGAKIVDAGCGPGASLGLLAGLGFIAQGVDLSPKYVAQAKQKGEAHLGRLEALPQGDSWANGLLCECSLNLSLDREQSLSEVWRVLEPNGYFILSDIFVDSQSPLASPVSAASRRQAHGSCLAGALTLAEAIQGLERKGFTIRLAEEYPGELKTLAAKLVWAYGLEGIGFLPCGPFCRPGNKKPRLTYALIISQKIIG